MNINDLIDALDLQSDFLQFFWDTKEKELVALTQEELQDLSLDRYIALPSLDKKALLKEFCLEIEQEDVKNTFLEMAEKENTFTHFSTTAHFYHLEDEWLLFIEGKLKEIAVTWCKKHGISYREMPREEKPVWL